MSISATPTDGGNLLIVDDEPLILRALTLTLRRSPFKIETAETPGDALRRIEGSRFDALLLDNNMPQMSGVELARHLRARGVTIGIVLMSGFTVPASAIEGIDGYLEKPFRRVADVIRVIADAIAAGRLRAPADKA